MPPNRYGYYADQSCLIAQDLASGCGKNALPTNEEAIYGDECNKCLDLMKDEMKSFSEKKVWEVVKLPPGRKAAKKKNGCVT